MCWGVVLADAGLGPFVAEFGSIGEEDLVGDDKSCALVGELTDYVDWLSQGVVFVVETTVRFNTVQRDSSEVTRENREFVARFVLVGLLDDFICEARNAPRSWDIQEELLTELVFGWGTALLIPADFALVALFATTEIHRGDFRFLDDVGDDHRDRWGRGGISRIQGIYTSLASCENEKYESRQYDGKGRGCLSHSHVFFLPPNKALCSWFK